MNRLRVLVGVLGFVLIFSSCHNSCKNIVILSQDKNNIARNWLLKGDSTLTIIDFYKLPSDSLQFYMKHSKGIIMTGGEDIHPNLYGHPEYASICGKIDTHRDSLEVLLLQNSLKTKKPILAICRGYQLLNVVNGGTLIPDIPTYIKDTTIKHRSKTELHQIKPVSNSWITKNFNSKAFMVNSLHHQCIDKIAPNFKVAAISPDGVIESIELKDSSESRFLIGVQFHPEMKQDSLSNYLRKTFLLHLKH